MDSITLNPRSQQKIELLQNQLPHAVLLTGLPGVGLGTTARYLAGKDVAAVIEPHNTKGEIDAKTGTITIETIRHLYDQTRAKHTKKQVIIIDDADRMSLGAQAAFLKLLEEPTKHTHFILTSHSPQQLLPTIRSRVQAIAVEPLTVEQTKVFIDALNVSNERTRTQLEYLAAGLPAELVRLIQDEAYFQARAGIITDVRTFLTGSTYQRLLIVNKYQKDRAEALKLLDNALAMTRRSLNSSAQPAAVDQLNRLLSARERIEANCSARLQLTSFVVQ